MPTTAHGLRYPTDDMADDVPLYLEQLAEDVEALVGLARFDVVAFGAVVDDATDDSAAIQAWLDAAYAYASVHGFAELYSSRNGVSLVAGPLVTAGGYNAQLHLPDRGINVPKVTMAFAAGAARGQQQPLFFGGQTVKQTTGWFMRTNLTDLAYDPVHGLPCMLGGPDFEKTIVPRGYVFSNLRIEGDLNVRLPDNPSITGINLRGIAQHDLGAVYVDTDVVQGSDHGGGTHNISAPTHPTGIGFAAPGVNCNGWSKVQRLTVIGTGCALLASEHTDIFNLEALSNANVIGVAEPYDHLLRVRGGNAEWNRNQLVGWDYTVSDPPSLAASADGCPVDLDYDMEDANDTYPGAGDWRIANSHIIDENNSFVGVFKNTITLAGGGRRPALIKTDSGVFGAPVGGKGVIDCPRVATRWIPFELPHDGWDEYGGAYPTPGYRKMPDGKIEVRGVIKDGVAPSDGVTHFVAQFPLGFRPDGQLQFTGGSQVGGVNSAVPIEVREDGKILLDGASNVFVSLSGISYTPA